jgi:hypothetical protein
MEFVEWLSDGLMEMVGWFEELVPIFQFGIEG